MTVRDLNITEGARAEVSQNARRNGETVSEQLLCGKEELPKWGFERSFPPAVQNKTTLVASLKEAQNRSVFSRLLELDLFPLNMTSLRDRYSWGSGL